MVSFTDKNLNGKIDVDNAGSTNEILQENHYYAFGERACSSHKKWLVGERNVAFAPQQSEERLAKSKHFVFKVLLRKAQEGTWQMNDVAKDNLYMYNSKELNTDHGLNWSDYGARWYDACVGRWSSVDPLADEAPDWTPYRYGLNNPIVYIDPDGKFETEADAKKYAKDNDIKTNWFSRAFGNGSKISENKDGTWSIDNKKEASSIFQDKTLADEAYPDGIFTGAMVAADDVMSGSRVTEQGLFGDENLIGFNSELRDGSTKFTPITAGEAPDLGAGKIIKLISRIPKGKTFYDLIKGKIRKSGQFKRKDSKDYLELDPKKVEIPTHTSRGRPFSPKVEPKPKSRWAKVMDLFGNFDDPRF